MKQPIALRIDALLLEQVRRCAADENRTITNFVETVLKREVSRVSRAGQQPARRLGAMPASRRDPQQDAVKPD